MITQIRDDQAPIRAQKRVQPPDNGVPVDGRAKKTMNQEDGRGRGGRVAVAASEKG